MSRLSSLIRIRPLHPVLLGLALSLLLAACYNGPLWRLILSQPAPSPWHRVLFCIAFFSFMVAVIQLFLGLLAWPRLIKPIGMALLLSAAAVGYFMDSYGILIDRSMVQNLFETDTAEATELISLPLLLQLLFKGVLPSLLILLLPLQRPRLRTQLGAMSLSLLGCCLVIGLNAALLYKDYSSLFRNHREIRNLAIPSSYLYYTARYLAGAYEPVEHPFITLGQDAVLKQHTGAAKPDLLVVVLGETARSQNFALNGYPRDTNPQLSRLPVVSFRQVEACGTSTAVSVPCMFSLLDRAHYDEDQAQFQSNVLDILQQAGVRVLWRDNNSGCKGVCARVEHQAAAAFNDQRDCSQQECFDLDMLNGLSQWLARAPGPAVIVLHQKGSHGPAYYRRVPEAFEHFTPVCRSNELQSCTRDSIVNAYDNSIRYTDHLLAEVIAFLDQQQAHYTPAMLYISDHGESLGENSLYLHGMPWMLAPEEQKRVPLITWLSPTFQQTHALSAECLQARRDQPLSHDQLAHSLLGLMQVSTGVYDPTQDLFAPCSGQGRTLAAQPVAPTSQDS